MDMKPKKHFDVGAVLRVYFAHAKRYPLTASSVVIFRAATIVTDIFIPLYYKKLLDALVASGVASPAGAELLLGILFSVLGFLILRWLFMRIAVLANLYLQPHVMNDLSQSAFSYLLDHAYGFFANNFTGSLVRRIGRLGRSFEVFVDQIFDALIPLTVSFTGIIIVLYLRHPLLGGIFLGWAAFVMIFQIGVARYTVKYNLAAAEKDSEATGALADAIGNDTTIRLFSGEEYERGRFKKVSTEAAHLRFTGWKVSEYVYATQSFLMIGIEFGLMYAALRLWGQGLVTIGDFALIQGYLLAAFDRLWGFGGSIRRMYESFADATEMVDIMNLPHAIVDRPGAPSVVVSEGTIEFRDVRFAFRGRTDVLSHFGMRVAGREKIALVGPSGAGKTTVTRLLLRFHDVTGGGIFIDGQNIAAVTQKSLRDAIAFVPQEPVLFHRTLMENIRYGRRTATDEEVKEAARAAHCEEFIARTPYGFETYVGERGIKLSGGERQRVALARAILKNAPILVLDEATSSLDSESEAFIQDALARLMEGKTVIAIAHRLSTVMRMDRIIVMEQGRAVTAGTHAELLSHEGGLYKKLWDIQAGGFIKDDLSPPAEGGL